MKGDRESYLASGMSDYVSKPIDVADLASALERQCGTSVKLAELATRQTTHDPAAEAKLGAFVSSIDRVASS
jgi:CheY-like chemotaxis protein